ncbi:(2Fe-2S)-binding protein [Ornithinimicrobium sp. Arc0846-15]|nr:(2Fe-2S)-binding protein [Ornithinimicrobium laminariae]
MTSLPASPQAALPVPAHVGCQGHPGAGPQLAFHEVLTGRRQIDWRRLTRDAQSAGTQAPPSVAATFVAQWSMQVLVSAAITASCLHLSPGLVADKATVSLHPSTFFPRSLCLPSEYESNPARSEDWAATAEPAYREWARQFLAGYLPDVAMSSKQRRGLVEDVWNAAAQPSAITAAGRQACCFIFALPGASECAGCPRRR